MAYDPQPPILLLSLNANYPKGCKLSVSFFHKFECEFLLCSYILKVHLTPKYFFCFKLIHLKKLLGSDWLKRSAFLVNTVQKRVTQCRKVKHECKLQRRYPKLKRRLLEANRCISKTAKDRAKPSKDFRRSPEHFRMFLKITRILPKFSEDYPNISEDHPNTSEDRPKTYDNLRRSTKISGYFRTFSKF